MHALLGVSFPAENFAQLGPAPARAGGGMAGAGAGAELGPEGPQAPGAAGGGGPRAGSDWANLPADLLEKVAATLVAQNEAGWAARLKGRGRREWTIQMEMAKRKLEGNCLFMFARVCRAWRKAQLKVGRRMCTRVESDVIAPGSVALAKWAPAEGCPRDEGGFSFTMAELAARYGHLVLVKWLCGEGGFAMDEDVMRGAAWSGNLELVQWLRGEGCPWNWRTCYWAVEQGHVEVLRWVRENGCPWTAEARDRAAAELGYTDDFGNVV